MFTSRFSHSSVVTLELWLGDRRIPLAQAAHNFAIAVEPVEFPPGNGVMVLSIDGKTEHIPVYLPEGALASEPKFVLCSQRRDEY